MGKGGQGFAGTAKDSSGDHGSAVIQRSRLYALVALLLSFPVLAGSGEAVRYLRLADVEETLQLNSGSGLPSSTIQDSAAWDEWIRVQDRQVRERIDRGVEDSISNFILYGTSFTDFPRLESVEYAASDDGVLVDTVNARIHALAAALGSAGRNERVRFIRDFLERKGIARQSVEKFFAENLRRFVEEQRAYQKKLEQAGKTGDPSAVFLTRGTLFENRGLSVDTSLLPNFALEDTLRVMVEKGAVAKSSIHRVAVIGPGLDFTDKRDGYDFYPLQTVQPFAVLEAVARLGLGKAEEVQVVCFDLNSAVIAHVTRLAEQARAGKAYTVQLPRDQRAEWSPAPIAYWEHFGEMLGSPVKPLPVPAALGGVVARAMAMQPKYAASMKAYDLNIVAQTLDQPAGQGFDLVVATNILVYYDRFQQALAMANIGRMMNGGGIFLTNNVLPAQHAKALEYVGRRSVTYTPSGAYGDDVVYRRR